MRVDFCDYEASWIMLCDSGIKEAHHFSKAFGYAVQIPKKAL